jgi:hypothetical protein
MAWTMLSIFGIAPLGALAFDGPPSATGSGTSTLTPRGTMGEHSGRGLAREVIRLRSGSPSPRWAVLTALRSFTRK